MKDKIEYILMSRDRVPYLKNNPYFKNPYSYLRIDNRHFKITYNFRNYDHPIWN